MDPNTICYGTTDTSTEASTVAKSDRMNVICARIVKNLRKAHKKHVRTYDLRSRDSEFLPGQIVMRSKFYH